MIGPGPGEQLEGKEEGRPQILLGCQRLGRFGVKRDLRCLPGDLDLTFFGQLTDRFGLCLDHITIDLQMPVQGLDLHL